MRKLDGSLQRRSNRQSVQITVVEKKSAHMPQCILNGTPGSERCRSETTREKGFCPSKRKPKARRQWLMLVTLATQDAEIRRITV
jgi:hypothetical protein